MLSTCCASVDIAKISILCQNLKNVVDSMNLPWVGMGDFNDITSHLNKSGGNKTILNCINNFRDMLDYCSLADLGFSGS